MNVAFPDVSLTDIAPCRSPLAWVGMQGIDLPVTVAEAGYRRDLHARVDLQVDLPAPQIKGIHMSRLYRLLDTLGQGEALSPKRLHRLLQDMVLSHQDCDSRNARLRVCLDLLVRCPALVSTGLSGWKSYPVQLDATLINDRFQASVQIIVGYSSTCPCSAALSRQLVEQRFLETFAGQTALAPSDVAGWLRHQATLATPHSQRSEAQVKVALPVEADTLELLALIQRIEQAVGTPVQTVVKRADEQAFAALNGQNLMFVEDAARRIESALNSYYALPSVHVRHLESLHPHNAVAWALPITETTLGTRWPSASQPSEQFPIDARINTSPVKCEQASQSNNAPTVNGLNNELEPADSIVEATFNDIAHHPVGREPA